MDAPAVPVPGAVAAAPPPIPSEQIGADLATIFINNLLNTPLPIPRVEWNEPNIKQLFQRLHVEHVLTGWFVDESAVLSRLQDVSDNVTRGETLRVRVRFRYLFGPLSGIIISEIGEGPSKDVAERRAMVQLLGRIANDSAEPSPFNRHGPALLPNARLDSTLRRCIQTTGDGRPLTVDHFVGVARLPVDTESATVDFKSYVDYAEISRQVIGFLNGRAGFGLLVCGVQDATWEVRGVRGKTADVLATINMERVVNHLDALFKDCNPPLQPGREYAVHQLAIHIGPLPASIILVEANRQPSCERLYKDNRNQCFARREARTTRLHGKEVYETESRGAEHGWTEYWR